ncbi:TIM barrel protein [Panacibacter ginsenosidivorans]|uniref:TIM barrel protein n=1 Tax=Panacibacter ginsenosidivorans TaxID=1813871 RepID=A0A5B8VBT1_9BACT|nr:TIM barrel protein [Panacibacter ginsenosidivorans]QEC67728.1 TIM barrel protein [Panacibacter ginsenosidivorans]
MSKNQDRRAALKNIMAGSAAIAAAPLLSSFSIENKKENTLKGNINHSVCQWTYGFLSVEELCKVANDIGIPAIDLMGPKDWPTLKKYNLYSSMCYVAAGSSLTSGWNDKANHEKLIKDYLETFPMMVQAGYKDVICFSGSRNGMDDETGLKNCVEGLQKILPAAEKSGLTVHMELLNSKVDHKDYMCDKTPWGVELCKRLNTENFKLLYDIYHMQIDEGDVIRTIRNNHQYIGHYHTGGVPGRHEIDESQELFYPAIMRAILETGYKGYVAQEFIPAGPDKIASLRKAVQICDV